MEFLYFTIVIPICFVLAFFIGYKKGKKKWYNKGWNIQKLNAKAESLKETDNLWFTKEGWVTGTEMNKLLLHTDSNKIHFEFVDQYGSLYIPNEAILDRKENRIVLFDTHLDCYDEKGEPFILGKI